MASKKEKTREELLAENEDLRLRLEEAEETLRAIRQGEVDALVVSGSGGDRIYVLQGVEYTYRLLVESMNEGAITLTKTGDIIYCNKAFAEMLDRPLETLVAASLRDFVSEQHRKRFDTQWKNALKGTATGEIELAVNGAALPVYLSCSARIMDDVLTVFAIVTDISERKSAEAELTRYRMHLERMVAQKTEQLQATNEELHTVNEELLATNDELLAKNAEIEVIINSISDAVIYTDLKRRIVLANTSVKSIFGYSPEELIGQSTKVLYEHGYDFKAVGEILSKEFPTSNRAPYEIKYRRKDGTTFEGEARVAPVRNANGVLSGFIGVHRDITQRKRSELELRRLNEQLEVANKELEAFSYSVSHDLRAPLRHMSGFAEILNEKLRAHSDREIDRDIAAISRAAKKMGKLIDDLLAFSRLGRAEMLKIKIDFNDFVRRVVRNIMLDEKRDIEWVIDDLPAVYGAKAMLEVVLNNLLANAVKFTRKSARPKIEIGYKEENDQFVFHVRDNGAGFNMKYADKLFGVFQRLHTETEFEGTGIGLANVKRIIYRHGGKVWAESVEGQGATFYFTLPKEHQ